MRRTILPITAILLTAACGSGGGHTASASSPSSRQPVAKRSHATAAPRKSSSSAAKPTPKTSHSSKGCNLSPTRDVILWYKTPGLPNSAQVVGNYDLVNCETTFRSLPRSSPTQAGYCTEAAWASDNPGYNADATPAKRLKKVQVAVGPAC
ncbi:hypothetical protein [Streptomyces hokutonensis]|uniref:hypothetical protein n=1 Tax=Streptomyces hokutonensis TaxID=1306990 RepID=UPI001319FDA9|nr:hypothetical protein [Streptomyces hokutonensis]